MIELGPNTIELIKTVVLVIAGCFIAWLVFRD